jgi:hypothetical protein
MKPGCRGPDPAGRGRGLVRSSLRGLGGCRPRGWALGAGPRGWALALGPST